MPSNALGIPVESEDGRFSVTANYEGTSRPQSWTLYDSKTEKRTSTDTKRDAKIEAVCILRREEKDAGTTNAHG